MQHHYLTCFVQFITTAIKIAVYGNYPSENKALQAFTASKDYTGNEM